MPKFAANLTMLFTEVDFLDRFERAAQSGFDAVEFLFPYAFKAEDIKQRLDQHKLKLVLHNLPAGDWDAGERGIACHPDRVAEFRAGVGKAIDLRHRARRAAAQLPAGKAPAGVAPERLRQTVVDNLRFAASELKAAGLKLLIEPINTFDIPGFYLNTHGAGALDPRRGGRRQHLRAVRHLPRAAHGRRVGGDDAKAAGAHRPHPARRQPGPQRTGHGRDQLRLHLQTP
jgi:hydroxypyruvate isomerase